MRLSRALALLVVLPALLLPFLPLALVWLFLCWAAALCVLAWRCERARKVRFHYAGAALLVGLAIAEVAVYTPMRRGPLGCAHDDAARPTRADPFDGVLGYGPVPGRQVRGRDMPGGRPEYDYICTIDPHGQRTTPPSAADRSVLFFGCSYTFGDGVRDREVAAWLVGEELGERARVHNFGFCGFGPHQALAAVQAGRVEELVQAEPRIVVYQLILSHVSRVAGRVGWEVHGPRYTLDESGRAVRAARFCDEPLPVPWFVSLARYSSLYRKLRSRASSQSEVRLLVAVLDEFRRELETRFPDCELHILFWNESRAKSTRIQRELERKRFRVHFVSELIEGYAEDRNCAYLSADDYHPHPAAHATVARYIVETICADLESDGTR